MTYQYKKTGFASVAALAVGALLAFAPMKAEAATCNPGNCGVTGGNGQNLSDMVIFGISNIRNQNDDPNGSFTFTADFFNDTTVNALTATTVLQFQDTSNPSINNLVLDITSPSSITSQSFQITDADGFPAGTLDGSDLVFTLDLLAAPSETIGFTLTGQAVRVGSGSNSNRSDPGISMTISAVPLPASALLLLGGLGGLGGLSALRRRKRAA